MHVLAKTKGVLENVFGYLMVVLIGFDELRFYLVVALCNLSVHWEGGGSDNANMTQW